MSRRLGAGANVSVMVEYRARSVSFLGVAEVSEWRLKQHVIGVDGEWPSEDAIGAALGAAARELPPRPGVGFVIAHAGDTALWVLIDWWSDDVMLNQRNLRAPLDDPGALEPFEQGIVACTWELAVLAFEREAWVRHVLREGNIEGYLGAGLEAEV